MSEEIKIYTVLAGKDTLYKCPLCDIIKNRRGLACHAAKKHKLTRSQLCLSIFHNGIIPLCECGCGHECNESVWADDILGYSRYLRGHNGFSDEALAKAVINSVKYRKENGSWITGKTKETDERVAKSAVKISATLHEGHESGRLVSYQTGQTKETSESVRKASETHKQSYASGKIKVWTDGNTKETDPRILATALKISQTMKSKRDASGVRLSREEVLLRIELHKDKFEFVGSSEDYRSRRAHRLKFKCLKCNSIQLKSLAMLHDSPTCFTCSPIKTSRAENEIYEFIKSLGFTDVIQGDRTIIAPKELDIFVPSKKFAVEFNGLYWHSAAYQSNVNYHYAKTLTAEQSDVRLFHIFEDEWRDKRDIVESMIRLRLGVPLFKLDARKMSVIKLSHDHDSIELRRTFFNDTHLDGDVPCKHAYALIDENKMPMVMLSLRHPTHKKWRNHGYLEIARFSTLCDVQVRGALGKLLAAVRADNKSIPLMTYVDRRLGDGHGYIAAGFKLSANTIQPRFWWTDFENRYDRFKIKADKKNGITEVQAAITAGVVKIHCCPNIILEMKTEIK